MAEVWHAKMHRAGYPEAYAHLLAHVRDDGLFGGLGPVPHLLDCGVGTGVLAQAVARTVPRLRRLAGIDISPAMLRQAAVNLGNASTYDEEDGHGSANHSVRESATAGVRVRPPLLFLASLILGLVLDRVPIWQPFSFGEPAVMWWTVGGSCLLVGLALTIAGIRNFVHAATPVRGNQPVRALVTTSLHGWSRNPIYLGMFLVYSQ